MKILIILIAIFILSCASTPDLPPVELGQRDDVLKSCSQIQKEMEVLKQEFKIARGYQARETRQVRYEHLYNISKAMGCKFDYISIEK